MDGVQIFTDLINSIGFPVAMVIYFIWDKTKITNQLTEAINNNNKILSKLLVILGHEELDDEVQDNE